MFAPKKNYIDPEALQKQKNRAKFRFRALIRSVMENLYWMEEFAEPYEGDDVQRRVEQVMKGKHKKKQLLSVADKALLIKPAKDRTEHEKRYIYRVIGGLKCFKRYPNHVKKKLAAVTYFKYYGPNRVVVREQQEAEALYFVVTGEVTVSKLIYDPLLQQYMSIHVFVFRPGDMFGEVSLLHNIPRTATCTTTACETLGHCEFLALMKEDFKNVLQGSLQKQWNQVRKAMDTFSYFAGLDSVARRDGCIIAKLKSYEPNETILGDGVEIPNFVYFVLSGRCQMIESLHIETINKVGKKRYKLHDDYVSPKESEQNLNEKYFQHLKKPKPEKVGSFDELSTKTRSVEPEDETYAEKIIKSEQQTEAKSTERRKTEHKLVRLESITSHNGSVKLLTCESKKAFDIEEVNPEVDDKKSHLTTSTESRSMLEFIKAASKNKLQEETEAKRSNNPAKELSVMFGQSPLAYKTYFMQVCIMAWGSTFNLGENMRDRRIIAQSRVDCMLLPKMWLMQQNTANVWSRILHYLEKKIPTKQDLFKEFVKQRRWQEYRDSVVKDVVRRSSVVNHTTVHDVPYSIRMDEMLDI